MIRLGPGRDEVFAQEGDNTVYAADDGAVDTIYCGPGPADRLFYDVALDPLDVLDGCETVEVVVPARTSAG